MTSKHKSNKAKKHSGRYTPKILNPTIKWDDIKIEALEPKNEYDEWLSWKDGFRDYKYYLWKKRNKNKDRKAK